MLRNKAMHCVTPNFTGGSELSKPRWITRRSATVLACITLANGGVLIQQASAAPAGIDTYYAQTGWATLHGDAGNRKTVPVSPSDQYQSTWSGLDNASVLTAPVIGPDGTTYVTTGLAPGQSNLYAYAPDGKLKWKSAEWQNSDDFDSCAVLQSPLVARNGDLYVSDCNQLWAFHPNGQVKWKVALPDAAPGSPWREGTRATPFRPLVTAQFLSDGSVMGITTWNKVVVVDPGTGALRAPVTQLPATASSPADQPKPPTLLGNGLLDPELAIPTWELFWGGTMPQANTPSVSNKTGRIFAVSSDTTQGYVYGIDYVPGTGGSLGTIALAFSAAVGSGSSSSPTISADGNAVYVTDNAGILYAAGTDNGSVHCSVDADSKGGSPTAGPDGNIYLLGDQGTSMTSYNSQCQQRWSADFSALAREVLPISPTVGEPTWIVGGPPTLTNDGLLAPISLGYHVPLGPNAAPFVATDFRLAKIDPATGSIGKVLAPQSGESDGFTVPNTLNRLIVVGYGAIGTSSIEPARAAIDPRLPEGHKMPPLRGGIEAFLPIGSPGVGSSGSSGSSSSIDLGSIFGS